ncbi:MAG: kelch repeat-containing protein [Cyanobacteria bacterium J06643_5]
MVSISNASARESEGYLVFDVTLPEALPFGQALTLALGAKGKTAKSGSQERFKRKSKNPIDFAKEFEFSLDDGKTWQPAENGNQITFGFGLTYLKVRLPINDDNVDEGKKPETLELRVTDVISGNIKKVKDTGTGSIIDDDGAPPRNVEVKNIVVNEGDGYAVLDIGLSSSSGETTKLELDVGNGRAKRGKLAKEDKLGKPGKIDKEDRLGKPDKLDREDKLGRPGKIDKEDKLVKSEELDYDPEFEISGNGGRTWQKAVESSNSTANSKRQELTIPKGFGKGLTKVRFKINDDDTVEPTETFTVRTSNLLKGQVDDSSAFATITILDNDPAPTAAFFNQDYQAEDATLVGPVVVTGRGSEGTGYADYQNPSGDYIEWTVNVPNAGLYNLSWRYQNGSGNRPLQLDVNGVTEDSSLDFDFTGGWTSSTWDFVSQVVNLNAGNNTIRLTATGSSGANFDFLRVEETGIDVVISDATATEGTDNFLVFDVGLAVASNELITLDLAALDGSARGGLISGFNIDPAGDPIDYANQEFEVSNDGGTTWTNATNGTEVSFNPGETALKVRLAINNDDAPEGNIPETMQLAVGSILAGSVRDATDRGEGLIIDNEASDPGTPPISLLPATDIRVEGNISFDFDGTDGGLLDGDIDQIGFTMVDPASNPGNPNPVGGVVGYWDDKLNVTNGVLQITATDGIKFRNANTQDNALGVGLNVPSEDLKLQTTLVNLPDAAGGFAQAGLWFGQATGGGNGTSEDNYIKLAIISPNPGNYQVQALMEQAGVIVKEVNIDIPDDPASLDLELFLNPDTRTVSAFYNVSGGTSQPLTTFDAIPDEWFSFDQAGINPSIATRSFGGVFATSRNAPTEQVFSFEDFSVTEESAPINPFGSDFPFDRWTLPVDNPTAMDIGPDGRLYVATLFGDIYAFEIDPTTRTFQEELITTIPDGEGEPRLTLGIAVDPDSTANNVILWTSHSNGDPFNGELNSGKLSRLSGPGFTQKEDVVTGLPRAIANHAVNNIDFGPDGRLYLWVGGNTGAGSANTEPTEFKDRPEQALSAAVVAVDIPSWKANPSGFNGDVASPIGEFADEFYARKAQELGRPYTEVTIYASGLRNTYDGIFHSNGEIYAPDNGLGVTGTVPPVPRLGDPTDRSITTLFGEVPQDNPGTQPDPLNRIVEGGYYGHPNPYRDEVVFKDGSFQGFDNSDADPSNDVPPGHPDYTTPFLNLGNNKSANGIIEYTADNFFQALKGNLFITNFSSGDNITRVGLTQDGLAPLSTSTLAENFIDPLPIAMGENGTPLEGMFFVGEFNGGRVSVMESLGIWRNDLPDAPNSVLDAGSAVINDKLYMVGGKTSGGHISNVYVYEPGDPFDSADDIWSNAPDLPGAAVENPAVVDFGGKLYSFGGSTAPFSGAVDNAFVFDPATNSWTPLPSMPTARGGANAEVLDGKIYVVGGLANDGSSVDTVEVFDPVTGTWSTQASLQTRRDNPGAAVVNDLLYVFGGRTRNTDGTTIDGALSTMEIFDPSASQWTFGAPMPNGRRTMSVGTLNDKIQVIGGEGNTSQSFHEEYNPATGAWRSLSENEIGSTSFGTHGSAFGTIGDVNYVIAGGPAPGSAFTDQVQAFTF